MPSPISASQSPDVVIVGGGIAGLAAGLRLKDRGFTPLVLEAAHRVGGRMTTDRVNGYAIDTGVTLLGNRYQRLPSPSRSPSEMREDAGATARSGHSMSCSARDCRFQPSGRLSACWQGFS